MEMSNGTGTQQISVISSEHIHAEDNLVKAEHHTVIK